MKTLENLRLGETLYTINNNCQPQTVIVNKLELVGLDGIIVNNVLANKQDTSLVEGAKITYLSYSTMLIDLIPKLEAQVEQKQSFLQRYIENLNMMEEQLRVYKDDITKFEKL